MSLTTSDTTSDAQRSTTESLLNATPRAVDSKLAPLPDNPVVIIEPSRSWVALGLRDLWAYRELLYFLVWRDVKVRYKQTLLGAVWAIIQPLFTMLLFTLFFGRLAKIPSDNIPYPIFAYAGLLPWTFFANAVTNSSNSVVGSSNLISKIYFPRMLIPGAAVAAGLVDFLIAFVIMVALMVYYSVAITWKIMMLPFLMLLTTMLAVAVGTLLAALNVKYRDIRYAVPFMIQLWMFASPIIYPLSLVPKKWHWILALNPMTGIIEAFRSSLFGRSFDWSVLAAAVVFTVTLLFFSAYQFRRMEKSFADII
jgi:lipopolysaccharide transport system permease protein